MPRSRCWNSCLPHLSRAMRISRHRQTAQALTSTSYQLPFGILLVGAEQHVIEMNETAEALLSRPGSALRVEAGRLVATSSNAGTLCSAIAEARMTSPDEMPASFDLLLRQPALNGRSGNLMISVMPLANRRDFGPAWEPMAAVMLREVAPSNHPKVSMRICGRSSISPRPRRASPPISVPANRSSQRPSCRISASAPRGIISRTSSRRPECASRASSWPC